MERRKLARKLLSEKAMEEARIEKFTFFFHPTWLGERIHSCRYAVREELAKKGSFSIGAFAEIEKTDHRPLEP